jgi:hypothetical protein
MDLPISSIYNKACHNLRVNIINYQLIHEKFPSENYFDCFGLFVNIQYY